MAIEVGFRFKAIRLEFVIKVWINNGVEEYATTIFLKTTHLTYVNIINSTKYTVWNFRTKISNNLNNSLSLSLSLSLALSLSRSLSLSLSLSLVIFKTPQSRVYRRSLSPKILLPLYNAQTTTHPQTYSRYLPSTWIWLIIQKRARVKSKLLVIGNPLRVCRYSGSLPLSLSLFLFSNTRARAAIFRAPADNSRIYLHACELVEKSRPR